MSEVIQTKYGKIAVGVLGAILIGLGAYLVVTHLVGIIEGAAGILLILVGLFLLDYAGR